MTADGTAALGTSLSLLHWWGLDPHVDEQLFVMLADLRLHCLPSSAATVRISAQTCFLPAGVDSCMQRVRWYLVLRGLKPTG